MTTRTKYVRFVYLTINAVCSKFNLSQTELGIRTHNLGRKITEKTAPNTPIFVAYHAEEITSKIPNVESIIRIYCLTASEASDTQKMAEAYYRFTAKIQSILQLWTKTTVYELDMPQMTEEMKQFRNSEEIKRNTTINKTDKVPYPKVLLSVVNDNPKNGLVSITHETITRRVDGTVSRTTTHEVFNVNETQGQLNKEIRRFLKEETKRMSRKRHGGPDPARNNEISMPVEKTDGQPLKYSLHKLPLYREDMRGLSAELKAWVNFLHAVDKPKPTEVISWLRPNPDKIPMAWDYALENERVISMETVTSRYKLTIRFVWGESFVNKFVLYVDKPISENTVQHVYSRTFTGTIGGVLEYTKMYADTVPVEPTFAADVEI